MDRWLCVRFIGHIYILFDVFQKKKTHVYIYILVCMEKRNSVLAIVPSLEQKPYQVQSTKAKEIKEGGK